MTSDRDPRNDLVAWLGQELRRARLAAGMKSQDQLARRLGFERTVITKIETGERPPSAEVAEALQVLFPQLAGGRYAELAEVARRAFGKFPGWFERDWLPVEPEAVSLRWWEPMLIPGLLQTQEYARALFEAWQPGCSAEDLEGLVAGRLDRQRILDREAPAPRRVPRPDREGGTRAMEHMNRPAWRTSSYSGGNGGACIEVAAHDEVILVRDSKDRGRGPVQRYTPAAWRAFVAGLHGARPGTGEPGRLA